MALAAVNFGMLSRQLVTRQAVVEFFLFKTDNIEIPAVVVAVTGSAGFPFCILRGMETHTVIDPAFYFLVATEAFIVRYFISQIVALCTIEHAFQTGMRPGQIARGQLPFHL